MSDFPLLFEERMRLQLGAEWDAFLNAHQTEQPVSIRINPHKKKNIPSGTNIPWASQGRYLPSRPSFTLDPTFHAGSYYVQDASSMFLEQAFTQSVDPSQTIRVLDLCAAPGGKSTHLLSLMNSNSLLVTNEVIRSRATILSENVQKWGYPNAVVTSNDPNDFHRLPGFFDVIVVDAPCSGEGLFRKDPEAKKEWSPENVGLCSQRQRRILTDVWSSLKQNGILIYCTCTYSAAENEDNLNWLQEHKAVESISLRTEKNWGLQKIQKGKVTAYQCYPHHVAGEGFFMAVLRKTEEEVEIRPKAKAHGPMPSRKIIEQLQPWITDPSRFKFLSHDSLVLMVPAALQQDIEFLGEKLRVLNRGIAVATVKHEKLVPEHAMALSIDIKTSNFEKLELTRELALSYLRKDTLRNEEEKLGFALVMHEGLPLGWVNLLFGRVNNLYPQAWRIRISG